MLVFSVIALLLSMFGATQSLLAAIRSHNETDVKNQYTYVKDTCGSIGNGGSQTALNACGYLKDAERGYSYWRNGLLAPTIMFGLGITILFLFVETADWTDQNGKAVLIQAGSIIPVKCGLGGYFAGAILSMIFVLWGKNKITTAHNGVKAIQTAKVEATAADVQPAA